MSIVRQQQRLVSSAFLLRRSSSVRPTVVRPPPLSIRDKFSEDNEAPRVSDDYIGLSASQTQDRAFVMAHFHPCISRALQRSKEVDADTPLGKELSRLLEKSLRSLGNSLRGLDSETLQSVWTMPARRAANEFANKHLRELLSTVSDDQLRRVMVFMIVSQCRNNGLWRALDRRLMAMVRPDLDMKLLGAFVLEEAKSKFKISSASSFSGSVVQSLATSKAGFDAIPFADNSNMFDSVSSTTVRDSVAIEHLSMVLYLTKVRRSDVQGRLDGLSAYAMRVLTTIQNPIKLTTLQPIWENLAELQLPNAYPLFRKLHQHVLMSIATDPLQIHLNVTVVPSLLRSMVTSKHKNSAVIAKLQQQVEASGLNHESVRIDLVDSLVRLEAFPFAVKVLQAIMDISARRIDFFFKEFRRGSPLGLTENALDYICNWLMDEQRHQPQNSVAIPSYKQSRIFKRTTADLLLALVCFGNSPSNTKFSKALRSLEALYAEQIPSLPAHELVVIVHAYGVLGRYHLNMISALDAALSKHLAAGASSNSTSTSTAADSKSANGDKQPLSLMQLEGAIWAFARLAHQSTSAALLKQQYIACVRDESAVSQSILRVPRFLWSLAVLEQLDIDTYTTLSSKFFHSLTSLHMSEIRTRTLFQGVQVLSELQCQASQLKRKSNRTALESETLNRLRDAIKELNTLFNSTRGMNYVKESSEFNTSSYTHLDISKCLDYLGIRHHNEQVLPQGYPVDIFIPEYVQQLANGEKKVLKDVVLEFDGPSHFDTYMRMPLGPTKMKGRHVRQLGHTLVTITCWQYRATASLQERCRVIQEALNNA